MTEAARQLLEQVRREFLAAAEADPALRALRERIDAGEGSYAGAEDYAYKLGELLSGKLREALGVQSDALLQEAAAEVLRGALAEDHRLVSTAAASVQEALNRQAGLGLKAETAPLDQDRVEGLAQRVQEAESYEKAEWLLKEPVKNFSQSVVDETLKRNVEAQGKAGLRPRIVRKASGGCCPWCAALAGKYDYPDVPKEVYQRHERCRCTVEYDPGYGKRRQDVWTKSWTSPEDRAIMEERKTAGLEKRSTTKTAEKNTAYEIAKNGGRHKGVYIDAVKKHKAALKKSIASHLKQVEIHRDKLAHPEKYDTGWSKKDERARRGMLKKWQKDLERNQEQAEIELEVWKERFGDDD